MITEEEFTRHCESVLLCGKNTCKFYKECCDIRKDGTGYVNFYHTLYENLVKAWRKEKLEKLLS